ncbi:hypothetical protein LTS10_005957 [Elasticomyces elasticus]|nr:hypothetical protein LTS10_005957 [Elasticomyces elasticus]
MPQIYPTASRNGQVVVVTVAFTLVVVALCLLTRLIMRWPWKKLMSSNDYLALAATLFSICNAVALCIAVQHGLGGERSEYTAESAITIRRAVLISHLFFYLGASCAISSVVEFLFAIKGTVRAPLLIVLRYLTPAWGATSTILIAIFIGLTNHSNTTKLKPAAYIVLTVVGCLLETGTFVAAAMITVPLQTSRKKRAQVMLGFSPSVLVIACFIVSARVLPTDALDPSIITRTTQFEIATELTLLFLIIYCTAAPLFQIGRRFQTGYNAPIIDASHTMSGSNSATRLKFGGTNNGSAARNAYGSNSNNGNYDMSSVTQSKLANQRYVSSVSAQDRLDREADVRVARARREKHMSGDGADGESMASDSSQKIIIRRTVEQTSSQM